MIRCSAIFIFVLTVEFTNTDTNMNPHFHHQPPPPIRHALCLIRHLSWCVFDARFFTSVDAPYVARQTKLVRKFGRVFYFVFAPLCFLLLFSPFLPFFAFDTSQKTKWLFMFSSGRIRPTEMKITYG